MLALPVSEVVEFSVLDPGHERAPFVRRKTEDRSRFVFAVPYGEIVVGQRGNLDTVAGCRVGALAPYEIRKFRT